MRAGITRAKQASISFLKKRNKKLLFRWLTPLIRLTRTAESKSFLVLFFKKELLLPVFIAIMAPIIVRADDSPEDRLRAALRQSVTEMRAAQDQASQAQAQLAQAQSDLTSTKAQLDAANAKLAELGGKQAAKPEELKALQTQLAAAQQQNAALTQGLSKFQSAVQQAQGLAREKDIDSQRAKAGLAANTKALETCKATNAHLIDVSEQVLHLYQDRSFIWVLRKSYEPLIGAAKVDLQNIVQDYDDKIRDQTYVPPPAPNTH
jgi:septal ring factor EnvC (AmiA/AmiB activator)